MDYNYAMKQKEAAMMAASGAGQLIGAEAYQPPTVGENIDRQIEHHMAAIRRLESTRSNLAKANLLDIKISDLREAMNY